MKSLQETIEQALTLFEDEEATGKMPVGEFVYRLVIAMVHAGMQDIAEFLQPMGTVVIQDRPEESLFDMLNLQEEEEEEGEEGDGGEGPVDT